MSPDELRQWMRDHKRTVRGLAGELGVSDSTVWRWMSGENAIAHTTELALRLLESQPAPARVKPPPRNGRRKRPGDGA